MDHPDRIAKLLSESFSTDLTYTATGDDDNQERIAHTYTYECTLTWQTDQGDYENRGGYYDIEGVNPVLVAVDGKPLPQPRNDPAALQHFDSQSEDFEWAAIRAIEAQERDYSDSNRWSQREEY